MLLLHRSIYAANVKIYSFSFVCLWAMCVMMPMNIRKHDCKPAYGCLELNPLLCKSNLSSSPLSHHASRCARILTSIVIRKCRDSHSQAMEARACATHCHPRVCSLCCTLSFSLSSSIAKTFKASPLL